MAPVGAVSGSAGSAGAVEAPAQRWARRAARHWLAWRGVRHALMSVAMSSYRPLYPPPSGGVYSMLRPRKAERVL